MPDFLGPIDETIMHPSDVEGVHVDIYSFRANSDRPHWTLITGGMSNLPQYVPRRAGGVSPRAEIMMYVQDPKEWMFAVLKGLAETPFDDKTYLHWYHTVPNGQLMTAEPSELTSFFFLPPHLEDPEFGALNIGGDKVDILLLVPITESEREYAMEEGSEALEEVFENMDYDLVVDESRASLL